MPTACRADLRLGFYPGISPAEVRATVEEIFAEAHRRHPQSNSIEYKVIYEGFQAEGFVLDINQPMIATLAECHKSIAGRDVTFNAFTGTTDARFFNLYGHIPATCYGPVAANIHGIDEWVSIDSMLDVASVLAAFTARWCGVNQL